MITSKNYCESAIFSKKSKELLNFTPVQYQKRYSSFTNLAIKMTEERGR